MALAGVPVAIAMHALAAASLVATALAGAPTVYLNAHLPSPADNQSMAALGASGIRVDFNWFHFQPTPTTWDWVAFDEAVDSARARGLGVYATLAYTPQWASSAPGCVLHSSDDAAKCENKLPATSQTWAAAVTAAVTRYRGKVECWGIWNEPNLRTFFDGSMEQFVTVIFEPAAAAIRAADPNARICGPELAHLTASSNWNGSAGTCVLGGCIRNGWERDLGQLLERIGPHLDVITHHVYKADAAAAMQALLDGETVAGVLTRDAVKRIIEAKGYGQKEFWLTEIGWEHPPQGNMPLADVATRVADLFTKQEEVCAGTYAASLNDPWPAWTRTYYYHFPYDPFSGWGLVGPGQAPLAPYDALKNWAQGRTTTACAGPGATPPPDAGVAVDAGAPDAGLLDAGAAHDAGGASVDAGPVPPPDAGTPPSDAGLEPEDAGSTGPVPGDAGGTSGAPDAGGRGGEPPVAMVPAEGGCGCATVSAPGVLLLAALARGRRRRC